MFVSKDIQGSRPAVLCLPLAILVGSSLHPRNPTRGTQQLVLPLAPLAQLGRARGVAAQVQEHLGSLAEALAGKDARAACDARAVGEELSARRFARAAAKAGV